MEIERSKVSVPFRVGVQVQRRDGHIWVKSSSYGLVKQARLLIMLEENRALDKTERVFFRDGDRTNVKLGNLVSVRFKEARFKYLPHAKIIYVPKGGFRGTH